MALAFADGMMAQAPLSSSTATATPSPSRRASRIPVTRVERFMLTDLAPAERRRICDEAYRIHDAYFPDVDRDFFERSFFEGDTTRVFLYYGADGALAGFSTISLLRVIHEGKEHAIFKGPACVDARYRLVPRARLSSLVEALRFKLLHPWMPVAYMGMVTTPSGYRLFTSAVPRLYPSRHAPTPPAIKALLLAATRMRGFEPVDEDKLLVRAVSRIAHPERLLQSRSLADDPDVRFYLDRNPHLGELSMLMYVPCDLGNIGRGLIRMLRRHLLGDGR